jgi:hypothetical protein
LLEKYSIISLEVLTSDAFIYDTILLTWSSSNQISSSIGVIDFTLSFLSIIDIVFTIFSIHKLSKYPVNNFLLFIFITKSQKFKSFKEL